MLVLRRKKALRRPEQRPRFRRKSLLALTAQQIEHAANTAVYVGSPEHKLPHARSDATLCPPDLEGSQAEITRWLRSAISSGNARGLMEGRFPRYVWFLNEQRLFEGRLTNHVRGEYKGYPIARNEGPLELRGQNA
jgi:hypothetical protein